MLLMGISTLNGPFSVAMLIRDSIKHGPFILDFPMKMVIFHSYVTVYQRVTIYTSPQPQKIMGFPPATGSARWPIVSIGFPPQQELGELWALKVLSFVI